MSVCLMYGQHDIFVLIDLYVNYYAWAKDLATLNNEAQTRHGDS